MTNLEHYAISAEDITDSADIRIIMKDFDWRQAWYRSYNDDLKSWLLEEYKVFKLRAFEHDLLRAFVFKSDVFENVATLARMKEFGYFRNVDETKTIAEILAESEVVHD